MKIVENGNGKKVWSKSGLNNRENSCGGEGYEELTKIPFSWWENKILFFVCCISRCVN